MLIYKKTSKFNFLYFNRRNRSPHSDTIKRLFKWYFFTNLFQNRDRCQTSSNSFTIPINEFLHSLIVQCIDVNLGTRIGDISVSIRPCVTHLQKLLNVCTDFGTLRCLKFNSTIRLM